MIEYRLCWNASSNVSFKSRDTEWIAWDDPEATAEQVQDEMDKPDGAERPALPRGLEEALESSGFEWWVETREAPATTED